MLPLGLATKLVHVIGSLERLCITNPNKLKGLKLFREHPLIKKMENKEKGIRYIACKSVLAARVDFYGNTSIDFSKEIAGYFQKLAEDKTKKRETSNYVRSRRGGLRHRKKVLKSNLFNVDGR